MFNTLTIVATFNGSILPSNSQIIVLLSANLKKTVLPTSGDEILYDIVKLQYILSSLAGL